MLERLSPTHRLGSVLDELPFWDLAQEVVFLDDGRMEVGIEIQPPSPLFASSQALEKGWLTLKTLLRLGIPEGERARVIVEAVPADGGTLERYLQDTSSDHPLLTRLTEAKADWLERERLEGYLLEWRCYLSCTLSPAQKRRRGLAFSPAELEEALSQAHSLRERLVNLLENAGYAPRPMDNQAIFDLIWRYLNPGLVPAKAPLFLGFDQRAGYLPAEILGELPDLQTPTLKRQLVASPLDNSDPRHLLVGERYLTTLAFQGMPDETEVGMIRRVMSQTAGASFYLVLDYQHEPYGPVLSSLQTQARKFYALANSSGPPDPSARVGLRETEQVIEHLTSTGDHVFKTGIGMVLIGRTPAQLERLKEAVISAFSHFPGALPVTGAYQNYFQYFALLPLGGRMNEFAFKVLESNAADLLPPIAPWRGSERPVLLFRNRWGSLTALDPFDPRSTNWNGLVVGGSGSGKTFFMQSFLAALLRQEADVLIVDRGYGYAPLVEALGGTLIPVEPGSVSINPFDLPEGALEPDDEKKAFLMAVLRSMIPGGPDAVAESIENALLTSAIEQTYARARTERKVEGQVQQHFAGCRLSDLVRTLVTMEEIGDRPASPSEREIARSLAIRLQNWTGQTPFGQFVDRPTSINPEASLVYYETTGLDRYPELRGVGILLIADLIWRRAKLDPKRRKVAVFDEAWSMLKIGQAREFIVELYRRARRYNTAVYAVSQSLQDFAEVRGILQNTSSFFLGRLPGEDKALAEILDLPNSALEAFRSLSGRKGQYAEFMAWIRREDRMEGDLIRVEASPEEYWLFTTNPLEIERRNRAVQEQGSLTRAIEVLAKEPK